MATLKITVVSQLSIYPDFDENDEIAEEVHEFLRQVLTKDAVRKYVIRLMSDFLSGEIHSEKFLWTGIGGNGKSKLIELEKVYW